MSRDINQRGAYKPKRKKQSEPFIQISSLVLNSAAYRDLSFSARSMLIEVVNYFNGRNNGSIFMAGKILVSRGFSKNTSTKALKELRSHGFLYMTRRGGNISGGCSWFAITWLPINKVDGQHLENFVHHAYAKWMPKEKNGRSEIGSVKKQKLGFGDLSKTSLNVGSYQNQQFVALSDGSNNHRICDL
jgi:hypothetical protein